MKKRLHFLATILSCALVMFSSCSDDDDQLNELEKEQAKSMTVDATAYDKWVYVNLKDGSSKSETIDPIAGLYKGDTDIKVAGKDYGSIKDLELKVSRISKDSVNFVLKDFAFNDKMKIDSVTSGAKFVVDSINGGLGYVFTGGQVVTEVGGMAIKATSKGYVMGKDINLTISVIPGGMPMPINAFYKGTLEKGSVDETSFKWDLAFHRWDIKTNGGSALETAETELANVKTVPAGSYVSDEESDEITVDMSMMMKGKIGYATDHINKELGKWMHLDMSTMPPAYTASDKVYVVKSAEGKCIKIKFTDYMDNSGKKGHISFDYASVK